MQINIFIEYFIPKIQPKNLVVYIFEKPSNSSASSYAYTQVRDSIYKIKSNLALILSLRNKYTIIQRSNKPSKLLLEIIKTTDKEMLILKITFLKDSKLWLQEGLYPDNIPLEDTALHRIISLLLHHSEEI